MRKHPNRISIWIPDKDEWIFDALTGYQQRAEDVGIPISKGTLIREALLSHFHSVKDRYDAPTDDPCSEQGCVVAGSVANDSANEEEDGLPNNA
jgi:hypothetical protein